LTLKSIFTHQNAPFIFENKLTIAKSAIDMNLISSLEADNAIPKIVPARHRRIPIKNKRDMLPTMTTSNVKATTTTISINDIVTTINDNRTCVMRISMDLTPASNVRFQTPSIRLCAMLKHEKPMAGKIMVLKKRFTFVGSDNFKI
jgi:hypothetical protein